ncbi:MAG: Yip1 family protein [Pseudorhodoplanes sp.]
MNIVERVKNILLSPDTEWPVIENESGEPRPLFLNYVAILAVIPAIAGFIGTSIIGITVSAGTFRVPIVTGLLNAVISYLFSFVVVYVVALVIDALASYFRGERHFPSALKLAVYSYTPVWLAGIFLLLPGLRFLTMLGLYGLYLLWTGLPPLMRVPRDQSLIFAFAVVVCAVIVFIALAILQGTIASLSRI